MQHLSEAELLNWISLYAATALCCLLAVIAAAIGAAVQLYREQAWRELRTVRGALLFVPRAWWRWQKLYLLGTPVILGTVVAFALSLDW